MTHNTITKIQDNKQNPCVSVIIPTHRLAHERTSDPIEMKKLIAQVKDNLVLKFGKDEGEILGEKLESLAGNVDYTHNLDGIGFFVSPEVSEVVHFPFEVTEKVMVGERFELRDLMYMSSLLDDYFLLSVTLNGVRLYKGNGSKLSEIINNDFPRDFEDNYEYAKPSQASGNPNQLKSGERKDKSVIIETRFQQFLKEADKRLDPYLLEKSPLIIAGVKQELGYFKKVTRHEKQIAGQVEGNYSNDLAGFGKMAFNVFRAYRDLITAEEIDRLREAIGKEMAVTGMRAVWRAAQEGKGLTLLVEKDLVKPGFVRIDDRFNLFLSPPVEKHDILGDAVETIIETVISKNGRVVMVENGRLTDFDQIALMLRYP
jgi:hypothetical protein